MQYYTIPLSPEPQSFNITLGGKDYRLTVRWLEAFEAGWVLDIEDPEKELSLIMGLPLITGGDLLEPFSYLNFGGELWLNALLPADFNNLGSAEKELVFAVKGKKS